jgi:nitrite reductase (cytochrome c-552)
MAVKTNGIGLIVSAALALAGLLAIEGCAPSKPEPVKTVTIPDGEIDPTLWGKAYPEQFETWKKTAEFEPAGKSKYKRGMDEGKPFVDKLSEYPYLAVLFNGWGFGVEYNEPRGHMMMMKDQADIDPSRLKGGGVCLSCKTPYSVDLQKKMGVDYYKKPYKEVLAQIPEKHHDLGAACIDCHDNKDMSLQISRGYSLGEALKAMKVDEKNLTRQDKRSLVCAQCHVTYNIPKDKDMQSVGMFFPWQGSQWGAITVENIIKVIRSDDSYREWKQNVTGFKMGFIRHPEFELYSNNSVHWKAGASCADCHMPFTKVGTKKISDHRLTSPLKLDMKPCVQCHAEGADWLKEQVASIQDRTMALQVRSGNATATVAKLFEMAHKAQADGKTLDKALYDKAHDFYEEAFYRSIFIGAENSIGFHNPTEAMRVLGDSVAFATKAEALLRQALAGAGVAVPAVIELEADKYQNNRGEKKLMADKTVEVKDPSGVQARFH